MLGSIPAGHPATLTKSVIMSVTSANDKASSRSPPRPAAGAAARPQALAVRPESIPEDLKQWPAWVVWRFVAEIDPETGEVDWDKPPFNTRTGGLASSTN